MATRRSTRVTQVDPWVIGGEGQLRDLFPLPPWVILIWRAIVQAVQHFIITALVITAIALWWHWDWTWWQAFLIFPIASLALRLTIITAWLWYKNPTIPLITRKP